MRQQVTEQEILEVFKLDERQQVEFKRDFIKTGDLAEIMMAFANTEGGTVYLGVDEGSPPQPSGRIQEVSKQYYDNIQRAARDVLVPTVRGVTAHEVEVQGDLVLAITVPETETIHQHQNGKILVRR